MSGLHAGTGSHASTVEAGVAREQPTLSTLRSAADRGVRGAAAASSLAPSRSRLSCTNSKPERLYTAWQGAGPNITAVPEGDKLQTPPWHGSSGKAMQPASGVHLEQPTGRIH